MHRSQSFTTTRRRPARPSLVRANSAKSLLHPRKPDIPVPPSLAHSPLLNSPHSMFRRAYTVVRVPSKRDEDWLRDTVPASLASAPHRAPMPRWWSTPDMPTASPLVKRQPCPPHSPPIIHWRLVTGRSRGWSEVLSRRDGDPSLDRQVMSAAV
ncbi:hypothetical protein BV25DRAFT_1825621 [Artomyces pyxidatus]|uniref:Uncharacterized protein n=1 Tax=Artomyces pyxidatus TaxID=48021 RepID=A0ACB8T0G0_9AGAM|nr:hypothetical protein BV25DRAFT_1825621 [Artomyces pyxidatus]